MRINWNDKPGNLRAIAAELNVGADSLVFLDDSPAERRNGFLSGLGWLDGHAIRTHNKPFVRCTQEQQIAQDRAIAIDKARAVADEAQAREVRRRAFPASVAR